MIRRHKTLRAFFDKVLLNDEIPLRHHVPNDPIQLMKSRTSLRVRTNKLKNFFERPWNNYFSCILPIYITYLHLQRVLLLHNRIVSPHFLSRRCGLIDLFQLFMPIIERIENQYWKLSRRGKKSAIETIWCNSNKTDSKPLQSLHSHQTSVAVYNRWKFPQSAEWSKKINVCKYLFSTAQQENKSMLWRTNANIHFCNHSAMTTFYHSIWMSMS